MFISNFFGRKKKVVLIAVILCLAIYSYFLFWSFRRSEEYVRKTFAGYPSKFIPLNKSEEGCRKLDLDPFHPDVARFIKRLPPLKCSDDVDWLRTEAGMVKLRDDLRQSREGIECKVTYLVRVNDFKSKRDKIVILTPEKPEVALEEDFFLAHCINHDTGKTWSNIMCGVHRDQIAVERANLKRLQHPSEMKLNVMMWGFDSVSRMHFMRQLKNTYSYVTKEMGGTVLEMYNIVGDGTPQALIPILTGFAEPELPETRKRKPNAQYVNIYPFVWKNYTENGYVTLWVEDGPTVGTFSYRLKGFNEKPVDHFGRPFYLEAEKQYRKHKDNCLGSKPRLRVMSDWTSQIFDVYPDVPKFVFGFHSELSHDDFNMLQWADDDTVDWLKGIKASGILNHTIMIVMSDHGNRFADVRGTEQGKLEERLPFFSFIFPDWFSQRFPIAYKNFKRNARSRLTTPFDLHATFLTILTRFNHGKDVEPRTFTGNKIPRSISLFEDIPAFRSCQHADIEPHWCTCLQPVTMSVDDSLVRRSAETLVDFINSLSDEVRNVCTMLKLHKILRAEKVMPNNQLLSFKKSRDHDGFLPDLSDHTEASQVLYQLQIVVTPSQGVYEASVLYNSKTDKFTVKESQISRVNMYGNQPHCVFDTHQHLRKYCYCIKQLNQL